MSLRLREDLYTAKKGKMTLNNEEINRYSRHLTLPEVGMGGQLKLKEAKVLMIGAGGLGSPLGMYLGAVGIGKLGLVVSMWLITQICTDRSLMPPLMRVCLKCTLCATQFWRAIPILKWRCIISALSVRTFWNCLGNMTSLLTDLIILRLDT